MIAVEEIATFGAVWATLTAGHNVADHMFGQMDWQAAHVVTAPEPLHDFDKRPAPIQNRVRNH